MGASMNASVAIRQVLSVGMLGAALMASGCNSNLSVIDHATFKAANNLESVRVSIVFTSKVTSTLADGVTLKDYGYLFVNPYTNAQPFEVGFDLNTSIVNDQDYIKLSPTTVLPNGDPTGVPYALVQVKSPTPISSSYDVYAYVDILHAAWLGTAVMIDSLNDKTFPVGLSVSQVFMRDSDGKPGITASVFGPTLKSDGSMDRSGGIAVFANVQQLLKHGVLDTSVHTFIPEAIPSVGGPAAANYEGNYGALHELAGKVVDGLNSAN